MIAERNLDPEYIPFACSEPEDEDERITGIRGDESEPPAKCRWHADRLAHPDSSEGLCAACELEGWTEELATDREWLAKAIESCCDGSHGLPPDSRWYSRPDLYSAPYHVVVTLGRAVQEGEAEVAKWTGEVGVGEMTILEKRQRSVRKSYPDAVEQQSGRLKRVWSAECQCALSAWYFESKDAWKQAAQNVTGDQDA